MHSTTDLMWYRYHGVIMTAAFAVAFPLTLVILRMALVRPSRRRTYHVFQFLTSSIGILATAGGGYIAYGKLPGGNTIDGLKNTHAILGTAILGVAVLVFFLGIFAGFKKKRVGYSHGLQFVTLVMVGLAAAASWFGLQKYMAVAGKSNKWLYVAIYSGLLVAILAVYLLLLACLRIPTKEEDYTKDFHGAPKQSALHEVPERRKVVYRSSGSLPPLVIGNEDFAHIGIPAEIQNRQSSGHSSPLTEGSDELPRSASTQPISSFRRQSSALRPPDGSEVGERQRCPMDTRGSRHSSTSPRTAADSPYSNTPSWATGSARDPAHLRPWLANSAVSMRPSEMEDVDILPKLPHKPRHPGDLF